MACVPLEVVTECHAVQFPSHGCPSRPPGLSAKIDSNAAKEFARDGKERKAPGRQLQSPG
jgi:hypothetical protein